jgi:aspartate dehydrogenase
MARGIVDAELKLLFDRNEEKVKRIQKMFDTPPIAAADIRDITSSGVQLVIEAASIEAVLEFSLPVLKSGKDMLILSVGAFSAAGFLKKIESVCRKADARVYLPSGAIGALDAVSAAKIGGLDQVLLTTTKNPRSFEGAPFITKQGVNLSSLTERSLLFSGNAADAIKAFPSNVNVAVALSLAGIGTKKTLVKVFADPGVDDNIHEIRAKGEFGELEFIAKNRPSSVNPKTSLLAAYSAATTLKKIAASVKIP